MTIDSHVTQTLLNPEATNTSSARTDVRAEDTSQHQGLGGSSLSRNYALGSLTEADLDSNPIHQFEDWLKQAIKAQLLDANAMTLATVGLDSRPSARIVLLKGIAADGFVFLD